MIAVHKIERIKRKLDKAAALTREAHELALTMPRQAYSDVQAVTATAADRAALTKRDWEYLEQRWRQHANAIVDEQRRLEKYGRCEICDTGAPADHLHCEVCGWSITPGTTQACHNRDCAAYDVELEAKTTPG